MPVQCGVNMELILSELKWEIQNTCKNKQASKQTNIEGGELNGGKEDKGLRGSSWGGRRRGPGKRKNHMHF